MRCAACLHDRTGRLEKIWLGNRLNLGLHDRTGRLESLQQHIQQC